ncbi:MAG: plasmid pRiA4b ORF-3 family protein [Saprospiraceae bacterium]|nr:plasmid pRiA4b ORF-3 family protein [Saprospiraceae bacterium]
MLLQFKIQIKGITKPPVWSRVLVPANFSFHQFQLVIQAAFGWSNCHLYEFVPTKDPWSFPPIGIPDKTGMKERKLIDGKKIKLSRIFHTKGQSFSSLYDIGDDWYHKILLEEVNEGRSSTAQLLEGKRACPSEDCGGVWGYNEMLEILTNPKHKENRNIRRWLGLKGKNTWDAHETYFTLNALLVQTI